MVAADPINFSTLLDDLALDNSGVQAMTEQHAAAWSPKRRRWS